MSKTIKVETHRDRYVVECDSPGCEGRLMSVDYYWEKDNDGEKSWEIWPIAIQHLKFCPACGKPIKAEASE